MNLHHHPVKEYFRYVIPTVTAMLVSGIYQIIDGFFVGHFIGASGLAAINITWAILGILIGCGLMIGVGTGALSSIYCGRKEFEHARCTLATGFMMIVFLSISGSGALFWVSDYLVKWQTQDKEVVRLSFDYLAIIIWSSPVLVGSIAIPFFIRNDGRPAIATWVMLVGAVVNIALDYLFIGLWTLELQGAAIATVISQAIVCIFGLLYFGSSVSFLKISSGCFRWSWYQISQIVTIGLSSFFMYIYWGIMVGVHNAQFDAYGGTIALGAYTILGFIVTFYYLMVEGVANSMQPLTSFYYGAQQPANIRILLRISLILAIGIGIVVYLLLILCPDFILGIFSGDNDLLLKMTKSGAQTHLFALCLDGFLVVAAAFYQSVNQGKKAIILTVSNIIIQPPLLYVLPKWYGLTGVWIAYPVSNVLLSLIVCTMLCQDIPALLQSERIHSG